jgi:hypothetical protein
MTAYQGARPINRPITRPLLPRRRLHVPTRAGRRTHPVGGLLALVLLAFLLGLIYLGQTVTLVAANVEFERLGRQRDDLTRQVQTVEAGITRYGSEQWVLDRAQRAGLAQLGAKIRIPAR